MATLGNPSYVKFLPLFKKYKIACFSITKYVAWAKVVHDLVRKVGCDWNGVKLNNVDRVRM